MKAMALIVGKGMNKIMLTLFLVTALLCLPTLAKVTVERIAATSSDRFYVTEGCKTDTCNNYSGDKLIVNSCQCICPANLTTFSVHQRKCIDILPDCTDLSFSQDTNPANIFTLLLNRNYQITPGLPVLVHGTTPESKREKEQCLRSNSKVEAYYEMENGFIKTAPSLIYTETELNETFIKFNQSHITDEWEWSPNGKLYKLIIQCTSNTTPVTKLCLAFKINGDQQGIYIPNTVVTSTAEEPSSGVKLSARVAFIVGGSILAVVVLACCITTGIILGYRKKSPEPDNSLIRVDRLSVNFNQKHPANSLVRNQSMPATLRDTSAPIVKKTRRWSSGTISVDSGDSGRGKSRSPSAIAAITSNTYSHQAENLQDQFTPKQPNLFQSQAQKLSTVGNGMTSIVETGDTRGKPSRKKTFRSIIQRWFGGNRLSRTKSDSKLSIDYDQFYITAAPPTKRFSDGHVNPEINFNEEGKISQSEDKGQEPTMREMDFYQQYTGSYTISHPTEGGDVEIPSLPVTSIDDVVAVSDFEAY